MASGSDQVSPAVVYGHVRVNFKRASKGMHAPIFNSYSTGGSSGKVKFAVHTWSSLVTVVKV